MQTSGPQATTGRKAEGEVVIGVRPEGMLPSPEGEGMVVTVNVIEDLGSRRYCADDFRPWTPRRAATALQCSPPACPGLGDRGGRADHVELPP
jgi:hypothetical protein